VSKLLVHDHQEHNSKWESNIENYMRTLFLEALLSPTNLFKTNSLGCVRGKNKRIDGEREREKIESEIGFRSLSVLSS